MFKSLNGLKQTPRSKNKVEIKYKQLQTKSKIYRVESWFAQNYKFQMAARQGQVPIICSKVPNCFKQSKFSKVWISQSSNGFEQSPKLN